MTINFPTDKSGTEGGGSGPLTDGDLFRANTGVLYTWVTPGDYWTGVEVTSSSSTIDGLYVNESGDHMTGPLTIGGTIADPNINLDDSGNVEVKGTLDVIDNVDIGNGGITFDASNGSAEFAGDAVKITDTGKFQLQGSGCTTRVYRKTSGTSDSLSSWLSDVGGTEERKIWFEADGSAEFSGTTKIGSISTGDDTKSGVKLYTNGITEIQRAAGDGGKCLTIYGGNVERASISSDGSAQFVSSIACERVYCMNGGKGDPQIVLQPNGIIRAADTTVQPLISERRLKENITSIDPSIAWQTIKNTPYYEYNFIDSDITVYGPMADEVPSEMVVQPMVEDEAGVMVARSDEEGPIRSYDNGMMQARLYTALQTALTRIEALEAEVAALKS